MVPEIVASVCSASRAAVVTVSVAVVRAWAMACAVALAVRLTACMASAVALPSNWLASAVLVLIELESCSMREARVSEAVLARSSICSVTEWAV